MGTDDPKKPLAKSISKGISISNSLDKEKDYLNKDMNSVRMKGKHV